MTYEEQLNTNAWLVRRKEILERDNYACQDCLRGKNYLSRYIELHVHHKKYIDGLMAWEYPDELLITLCEDCHQKIHGIVEDRRSLREKPTFVHGHKFESRPVVHISEWINGLMTFVYSPKE